MRIAKASAPGKLIISGEHAVVYGYPALVTAIDRRLTIKKEGRDIQVTSNVPIGAGMGSSAALAVAISTLKLGKLDPEKINELAYKIEKRRHGNPSGVDNTIVTYGGFLWYRKEVEGLKIFEKIKIRRKFPKIYLLNSGKPAESTKEMVEYIAGRYKREKPTVEELFKRIEAVTRKFLRYSLGEADGSFDELLKENELLLEKLGVVSSSTKRIIRKIEKMGGYAKVSGAGGRKRGSGILIVYHKNYGRIRKFAERNKLDFFPVKIGEEGVRIEK
jgi:mevalonate kinase